MLEAENIIFLCFLGEDKFVVEIITANPNKNVKRL